MKTRRARKGAVRARMVSGTSKAVISELTLLMSFVAVTGRTSPKVDACAAKEAKQHCALANMVLCHIILSYVNQPDSNLGDARVMTGFRFRF